MKIKKQFSHTRLGLRNPQPNLAARWEGMAVSVKIKKQFSHKCLRNPQPNLAARWEGMIIRAK
ncbi:hypothetical protein [Anaerocolumna jejuensis]|uniref:hypothetical protein n=1 Tax=Anaerocolumna jejuensis TaxID=259063 RepID=UPI000933BC01|nr:hypothetical protein [Anaerocolumna jejuensis]